MVAKGPGVKFIMAQYPDLFIMHFSMHVPNFVLLSQNAQLLLLFIMSIQNINKYIITSVLSLHSPLDVHTIKIAHYNTRLPLLM